MFIYSPRKQPCALPLCARCRATAGDAERALFPGGSSLAGRSETRHLRTSTQSRAAGRWGEGRTGKLGGEGMAGTSGTSDTLAQPRRSGKRGDGRGGQGFPAWLGRRLRLAGQAPLCACREQASLAGRPGPAWSRAWSSRAGPAPRQRLPCRSCPRSQLGR